jgi:sugar phosphate isomerase/epimerase
MNRIKNIKIIGLLLLLSAGLVHAQTSKSLFPEMPGMASYTFRNSFQQDVEATLDTLKQMGLKDIEFASLYKRTAADIRKMLDERGLYCSSFAANYADLVDKPREVGQNAATLGASYVMVAWIPHQKPFKLEDAQKAVSVFNAAGKILKDEFGIELCYHNHGYEFQPYGKGTLFDYIVQETHPKYVGFEIDIVWAFFPGVDPAGLIKKHGNRFKLLHLKDLRKGVIVDMSGKSDVENDVVLGTGQLDIPSILKAARKAGIKHYYIEDESPDYYRQIPQTIQYLKSL